jgi:cytidylate kinase
LQESGKVAIYQRVLQDIEHRDARDRERQAAPLRRADDALGLDTTALDADAAFERAVALVEEKLAGTSRERRP